MRSPALSKVTRVAWWDGLVVVWCGGGTRSFYTILLYSITLKKYARLCGRALAARPVTRRADNNNNNIIVPYSE